MTVKELKELLSKADEKLNVVIFNGDNELKNIKDAGKSTLIGACDKKGNLLPYGNNPKYNIDVFILEV